MTRDVPTVAGRAGARQLAAGLLILCVGLSQYVAWGLVAIGAGALILLDYLVPVLLVIWRRRRASEEQPGDAVEERATQPEEEPPMSAGWVDVSESEAAAEA